jgi:hypothetical protein
MKYCEQLGVNRQPLPGPQIVWSTGEITHW